MAILATIETPPKVFKVVIPKPFYRVSIYKSLTGRWCIRHPSGASHRKHFASLRYTKQFCKKNDWEYVVI